MPLVRLLMPGLERIPIEHGFMLRARWYTVRYQEAGIPSLELWKEYIRRLGQ
jgi:hypothetical protein